MPFVFLTLSVIFLIYQFLTREESIPHSYYKSIRLNFNYALVSLVAYAIESDQRLTRLEFEYIRRQFFKIFRDSGESSYPSFYLKMLNIFRKENLPYQKVTDYLKTHESRNKRFTLLRLLYGVVVADNQINDNEWEFLRRVTVDLGLNLKDLDYINSLYQKQQAEKETKANYQQSYQQQAPRYTQSCQTDCYKVLGITPSATDAEIKKAYRSLAKKFHPDTVASFGEEIQKETEEKFRQIQEAYEKISTLRGIK